MAGEKPEWWDDAAVGLHYGAWVGLVGYCALLLTRRWWARPWKDNFGIPSQRGLSAPPRWFWPLVAAAALVGLGIRLPLASKSLWWDEAWVVQQVSHGKWKEDAKRPGELRFLAHDWKRCAFYYQKPTNHVPVSLAQKTSLLVWQKLSGASREAFNDLAARIPALLASLVAVVLIAGLLQSWGQPGAGVVAAFVLALHPWAIRHGVDTRAYAFVIPLCIGGMYAATSVVRSSGRSLPAWVAFALVELVWLWGYPNAVFDIAALNLVTLAFLLVAQTNQSDRWTAWWRLAATNVFAALVLLQLFLPNLFQARRWAGAEKDHHFFNRELFEQTVSNLLSGLNSTEPDGLVDAEGIPYLGEHWLAAVTFVCLIATGGIFIVRSNSWRKPPLRVVLPLSFIVSSLIFTLVTRVAGTYFYPRFIIAALPCLILLGAQAVAASRFLSLRRPMIWSWTFRALTIASFVEITWPGWVLLTSRPLEPVRDAADFVHKAAASQGKVSPLIVCYGLGREALPLYEPHCHPVISKAELNEFIVRAETEKRPLYAIYGYATFNRTMLPDGFKLLDDKTIFTEIAAFPGIEHEFYFRVLGLAKPGR